MAEHPEEIAVEPGRILFPLLAKRGIANGWAVSKDPLDALKAECRMLVGDSQFTDALADYLDAKPIIQASCKSMLAHLAFAAGASWQDTKPILQPLYRPGWHIARWLPTFLLIDGPLGRLFKDPKSPLSRRLRGRNTGFPFLSEARDAFNHDTFRVLRNGFGHWSFEWIDGSPLSEIRIVNWESGEETARLSLLECEAFHFMTVSVVRMIDREIFAHLRGGG